MRAREAKEIEREREIYLKVKYHHTRRRPTRSATIVEGRRTPGRVVQLRSSQEERLKQELELGGFFCFRPFRHGALFLSMWGVGHGPLRF